MKFYRTTETGKYLKHVSRFLQFTIFVMLVMQLFSGSAMASGGYLTAFSTRYPSSTSDNNASCNLCHSNGGGTDVNGYGKDFAAAHNGGLLTANAFAAIEGLNSDNNASGATNLAEITANTQPGWTLGAVNQLYDPFSLAPTTVISPPTITGNQLDPAPTTTSTVPTTSTTSTVPTTSTSTTTSTVPTTTSTVPTTTSTVPTTTSTVPTTTSTVPTTTSTVPTTTSTVPTTTSTVPTTTSTVPTTTSTVPTTTSTVRPTTTSTVRPTTTTTRRPTTTTTRRPTTTTTRRPTTTTTRRPTTTTTRRPTTTTTRRTTTTTASTTTTTLPSLGAALYNTYCADCHDGPASFGGGRNVVGARTCSIDGAINGTSVFPGGVLDMQFLKGLLSPEDIQAISDSLNSNPVTGQQRYITACAGCHGIDGRGGRVHESAKGSAGDILEAIDEERPMSFLGCLPASDVKDIGTYLQSGSKGKDNKGKGKNKKDKDDRRD